MLVPTHAHVGNRGSSGCVAKDILSLATICAFLSTIPSPSAAHDFDCQNECSKTQSPHCFPVEGVSANADLKQGFPKLFKRMISLRAKDVIAKPDLEAMFGVTSDPCERSGIVINDGQITNYGTNFCEMNTFIPVPTGVLRTVIIIPPRVEATISIGGGGARISFAQTKTEQTPILFLGDDDLNEGLGGHIVDLFFSQSSSVISTVNGCLQYTYGK